MVSYTPTVRRLRSSTFCFVNEDYPNNPADPAHGIPISGDIVIRSAPAVTHRWTLQVSPVITFASSRPPMFLCTSAILTTIMPSITTTTQCGEQLSARRATCADADGSGVIDSADYVAWRSNLGYSYRFPETSGAGEAVPQQGAVVPEASSLVILTGGIVLRGISSRPRRRSVPPM